MRERRGKRTKETEAENGEMGVKVVRERTASKTNNKARRGSSLLHQARSLSEEKERGGAMIRFNESMRECRGEKIGLAACTRSI